MIEKPDPRGYGMRYFVVTRDPGPEWNASLPRAEPKQWGDHAELMNRLAQERFIVLRGPVGDGSRTLLVINAEDESTIERRLAADPWTKMKLLRIAKIEPWEILLEKGG